MMDIQFLPTCSKRLVFLKKDEYTDGVTIQKGGIIMSIYLGTVALETNRWAPGRIPTFAVSDYADRAAKDGFDGLELWENHFMLASEAEQDKLASSGQVAIFNSYGAFHEGLTDNLRQVAAAINRIHPKAIKYNLNRTDLVDEQVNGLLAFADLLTSDIRLLCECHAGTCMEQAEAAAAVFARLDDRFGAIIHLKEPMDTIKARFDAYGDRICHIHAANWNGSDYEPLANGASVLLENLNYMKSRGFAGTYTLEFTYGLQIALPALYDNAVADLKWLQANGVK